MAQAWVTRRRNETTRSMGAGKDVRQDTAPKMVGRPVAFMLMGGVGRM